MKKRILSLMMAAVLVFSLAACSSKKPAEEAPAEEAAEEASEEKEEAAETETSETEAEEAETAEAGETAAEEEDSIEQLVSDIAHLEVGTAGSQLKATGLAARFISLCASGQVDLSSPEQVIGAVAPEDKDQFIDNFVDFIWPIVQEILNAPDQYAGILEDLGIAEEFTQMVNDTFTEDDIKVFTEFAEALKQ